MHPFFINLLPASNNEHILKLISLQGIDAIPKYIDIEPEFDAENGSCFVNVKRKVERAGGRAILGWQFCEYSYMIEGEFHSIWESPVGRLIDITPGNSAEIKQTLFVVDKNASYSGTAIDNIRINTTDNKLVDDVIEIEEAKFKLEDQLYTAEGVAKQRINKEVQVCYHFIELFSTDIDFFLVNNGNMQSPCYCNSGMEFQLCHRIGLKELISTINSLK